MDSPAGSANISGGQDKQEQMRLLMKKQQELLHKTINENGQMINLLKEELNETRKCVVEMAMLCKELLASLQEQEKTYAKIASLQANERELAEKRRKIQREFEELVASPIWGDILYKA